MLSPTPRLLPSKFSPSAPVSSVKLGLFKIKLKIRKAESHVVVTLMLRERERGDVDREAELDAEDSWS